jgi:hypothetical protein
MADPIAVIIRFDGDPDDLFERFERRAGAEIVLIRGAWRRPKSSRTNPRDLRS